LINRTQAKAARLAQEIRAQVRPWDRLPELLREANVVVSATSAPGYVISAEMARNAWGGRGQALRFVFDLAVPRDVDPEIGRMGDNVFLYDIDDVQSVVDANRRHRQHEVMKVERLIQEELVSLQAELGASRAAPVIRSLRDKAEAIRQAELEKALNRLPNLSEQERKVINETTRLILNKFLNDAMVSIRQWGADEDKAQYLSAVQELFRLPQDSNGEAPVRAK
jgi:glutamyl-tRNA reductase